MKRQIVRPDAFRKLQDLVQEEVPWDGPPNPGTDGALCKFLDIGRSTVYQMRCGLPVAGSTAQKVINLCGPDAIERKR